MRRPCWARLLPMSAVLLAIGAATLVATTPWDTAGSAGAVPETAAMPADAVRVSSDGPRFPTLDNLVAASDVVVRGRVVATERGRWFGDEASTARVQSRLVTLEVDEVLAGTLNADALVIEEEGWLSDGSPLVVDGAAPSRSGDEGIWFLAEGGDPTLGAHVVVGAQGRYLVRAPGDPVLGATLDDPLIADLSSLTATELEHRLRSG